MLLSVTTKGSNRVATSKIVENVFLYRPSLMADHRAVVKRLARLPAISQLIVNIFVVYTIASARQPSSANEDDFFDLLGVP